MSKEPDWTAENMNREKGATTFKQCGWCKHAGCGSYRYSAMLEGKCDLMKDYAAEVQFDTPCKIIGLAKADFADLIRSKNYEITQAKNSIKTTQREISELRKLEKKAAKSPPLPDSRTCDYHKIGGRVWVFIDQKHSPDVPTGWYVGTIVNGYRSGDGCVSYVLDKLPESKKGWGCGMSSPCVLLDWEYKFFCKNPPKFSEWLKASDREYNAQRLNTTDMFFSLAIIRKTK